MRWSVRSLFIPVFLALVTAVLYLPDLQGAPAFLSNDEVCIALNARAIAATGRDVDGRVMPSLFYSPKDFAPDRPRIWFLPFLVYLTALVLKVLPFTETAIRLPLVLAAVADVVLAYVIVLRVSRRVFVAAMTAALLALTPSHFFHARLALPAQISGPFVLGWLLCVLVYLECRRARWLAASGALLGVAAVGYIGPLVLVYGLLTWAVLLQLRARWTHYAAVVAGGFVPCLYFLWLARDPVVVQQILGHYGSTAGAGLSLYFGFWSPDFLFVEGAVRNARAAGAIGVFLLPIAGLVVLGLVEAVRRRDAVAILLLGGFFSAPIAASFVGESHAIWRALEVVPFGVLLASLGLDLLLSEERSPFARWTAYLTAFGVALAIALAFHDHLQHAQPMIRMLILPLGVLLLARLARKLPLAQPSARSLAVLVGAVAVANIAYATRAAEAVNVAVPVLAIATLMFVQDEAAIVAMLGLLASEFLYLQVDYPAVHRISVLPASAVLMFVRLGVVALALALGAAMSRMRFTLTTAIVLVVAIQIAYFHEYRFDDTGRFAVTVVVLALALSVAWNLARLAADVRSFACLGVAGVLAAAIVQFGYFYTDYLTRYPTRNVVTDAGNVRLAWDRVIDEAGRREVPAVLIGPIGAYEDAGLYWRFYLIKHHREDLLARTIESGTFDGAQIDRLPAGSLAVASPSTTVDRTVKDMKKSLVSAPDGTPLFWIVEKN